MRARRGRRRRRGAARRARGAAAAAADADAANVVLGDIEALGGVSDAPGAPTVLCGGRTRCFVLGHVRTRAELVAQLGAAASELGLALADAPTLSLDELRAARRAYGARAGTPIARHAVLKPSRRRALLRLEYRGAAAYCDSCTFRIHLYTHRYSAGVPTAVQHSCRYRSRILLPYSCSS